MTRPLTPDICIIGAGPGALPLAMAAAAFGAGVVLVENGRPEGALSRLVPQALAAAARQAETMRSGEKFGIGGAEPEVDFKAVMRHARHAAATPAPNTSAERLGALGVRVISAEPRFGDRRTLIAGETEIRARRFVLATRSLPVAPPVQGLDGVDYLTEDTVLDLPRRPGHLIVLAGRPEGIELAQSFRRLGSDVTVLSLDALSGFDPEMAAVVMRRLNAEGVALLEQAAAMRVERRGKAGIRLSRETAKGPVTIDGTHLLVAAGRGADIRDLHLDKAGIAHDAKGVAVDAAFRTGNRRVHAIGDVVAGSPHSLHVAEHQAALLAQALLFRRTPPKHSVIPAAVFTDPELAQVGLTESEAAKTEKSIRILRWPYAENDRAQAERQTEGHIKLVVGARGQVLGATIAGANAAELIGVWTLALSKGLTLRDMASHIVPHPTLGEIGKRAAMTYFAGAARKPLLRRLSSMLRIFG